MSEPSRKSEYTKDEVFECYAQLGSIPAVTQETGCPPYIVFKWLKMAKLLKSNDGLRYGTISSKKGFEAENEFKKLVPYAMPSNETMQKNCPSYDFDINGTTVDVKFCSLTKQNDYVFKTSANKHFSCDFYAVFLGTGESRDISGGYRVLVIPAEIADTVNSISIKGKNSRYWDFEISPDELANFFADYLE